MVLAGWDRFLNLLFVMKDGMSSFKAAIFRVGDVIGWGMDWVRESDTKEAESRSWSFESTDVVGGGVTSSVNHMGWYHLRARVARRRWMVCCCV